MLQPKIKQLVLMRKRKNLSQRQLSLLSQLDACTISRIEKGTTKVTHPLRAREIARALGCEVEDIFTPIIKGE